MKKSEMTIDGIGLPVYTCNTLIIGSGAASLNCADHLHSFGTEDILIVTECLGGGTSNNSGSDKQTYYKLSLFGDEPDSTYEMARTLYNGGSMHGDIALVEATMSAQEFYHLIQIGVPFPHNYLGGYVGYKTDHDPRQRATSAGPWTSSQMFNCLLEEIQKKNIDILDKHEIISLLVTGEDESRVIGAIGIDKDNVDKGLQSLVLFKAENVVLGTGGPGGIYETRVFPEGHLGSTGIAIEAGAKCVNMTEWQYGIASTKFRWNLSGTYQQVIPRYISTDMDGNDEREFLNDYFPSMGKLATDIFLKGYQWPFDPRKIENLGSSIIDVLVYNETVIKGRRVFLDFTKNPEGDNRIGQFSFDDLEEEAYEYLKNSNALFGTPIQRLMHMNKMSIELYSEHGIDITSEPLEIAVCAQHTNGGLVGNIWWESNIKHLFPVGEVNGTHGVYRPGGSALNSGQCGSYRAAQYISAKYNNDTAALEEFLDVACKKTRDITKFIKDALKNQSSSDVKAFRKEFRKRMSRFGAHVRKGDDVEKALKEARSQLKAILDCKLSISSHEQILQLLQNRQMCFTQVAVLESIKAYIKKGGGSRGSYMIMDDNGQPIHDDLNENWKLLKENEELRKYVLEIQYKKGNFELLWDKTRQIPEDTFWFENVWNEYLSGTDWMDKNKQANK